MYRGRDTDPAVRQMMRELQKRIHEGRCEEADQLLELTVPLKAVLADGEKYMTNAEIGCVYNLLQHQNREDLLADRYAQMLMAYARTRGGASDMENRGI